MMGFAGLTSSIMMDAPIVASATRTSGWRDRKMEMVRLIPPRYSCSLSIIPLSCSANRLRVRFPLALVMNNWEAATAKPEAMTSAERLNVDVIVIFMMRTYRNLHTPALTPSRQLVAVVRFHCDQDRGNNMVRSISFA